MPSVLFPYPVFGSFEWVVPSCVQWTCHYIHIQGCW